MEFSRYPAVKAVKLGARRHRDTAICPVPQPLAGMMEKSVAGRRHEPVIVNANFSLKPMYVRNLIDMPK